MEDQRVIIFDFDGTLADTIVILRNIYDELSVKNGWTPMTDETYDVLRKGSIGAARKWSGIRFWQFPLIVGSVRRLMKLESEKVKLFPGAVDLIRELRKDGFELYVLSRNSRETITHVLERYKLQNELHILSRRRRTLGSKTAVVRRILREKGYNPKNVWMVGDEVRDIEAGKKAGVPTIAVTWGLQDESLLARYNPTHIARTIAELRALLLSKS